MLPKYLLFWCLIPFCAHAQKLEGTYSDTYKTNGEAPYHFINIHRMPNGGYLFYLEVCRGAPSYNSGAMYGKLTYNKATGNYEYLPVSADDCKLVLSHKSNKIIIKTISGDCPFGYGVYADATYKLRIDHNPSYCFTRTGKKVYFNKTPPGKFTED